MVNSYHMQCLPHIDFVSHHNNNNSNSKNIKSKYCIEDFPNIKNKKQSANLWRKLNSDFEKQHSNPTLKMTKSALWHQKNDSFELLEPIKHKKEQATQASDNNNNNTTNQIVLSTFPHLLTNSNLVHKRAKDVLASSLVAGATLPLLIGANNSNELKVDLDNSPSRRQSSKLKNNSNSNTNSNARQSIIKDDTPIYLFDNSRTAMPELVGMNDTSCGDNNCQVNGKVSTKGVIDDFLNLEQNLVNLQRDDCFDNSSHVILRKLIINNAANNNNAYDLYSEQQLDYGDKQQMHLLRREETQLNLHIKRQNKFIVQKLAERLRQLQIMQNIWRQRDFKHAIEKLVDFYNQGLTFSHSNSDSNNLVSSNCHLLVDVLSIILLKPSLWSLEICELLLPLIVNDLLVRAKYENYLQVAVKCLKLITTQFYPLIKTTLQDKSNEQTSGGKFSIGVDIVREDRIKRCQNCLSSLLDAQRFLEQSCQQQQQQQLTTTTTLSSQKTAKSDSASTKLLKLHVEARDSLKSIKVADFERLNLTNADSEPLKFGIGGGVGRSTARVR